MNKMNGKLKNKIFRNMFLLAIIMIFISVGIATGILYKNTETQIVKNNKATMEYMQLFLNTHGVSEISNLKVSDNQRITLISPSGEVLYDNHADNQTMENHLDRPEVEQAVKYGTGSDKRVSSTIDETSYYYAVKLEDGNVLRVATTAKNIYSMLKQLIPVILLLSLLDVVIAVLVANYQTKKIVEPINSLEINGLEDVEVYDELSPFVTKIRHQTKLIEEQMEDLKAKKIEFETITENMSEGLLVLGKDGRIISYNKSAMELLGVDKITEDLSNILMFTRNKEFVKYVEASLKGKKKNGMIKLASKCCQVIANPIVYEGNLNGSVVLILDVTEQEMRESMRREFSANVSHELKTPLTAISGYAEIMKTGIVKNEDMVQFSDIIYSEAARLINLVNDIMEISKLDEDKIPLEASEFDLTKLVKQTVERLSKEAAKKEVTIHLDAKDSYEIYSVKQLADEMLFNVIENAIKYNKRDGNVKISLDSADNKVIVKVEDSGIGIPKEDINRVCERFYRVDKSHSREFGGTGLGLSIVKHAASCTNTRFDLQSVEGKGTCVTFEFPMHM